MSKTQLLLAPRGAVAHEVFARRVRDELVPRALERGLTRAKLTFTEHAPPRLSVVPFTRTPIALISGWDGADGWWRALATDDVVARAYRVEESVPRMYEKTWPDGEATPGVNLLTTFRRKHGLDDETFFARWHGGHTPLSLRIHPLFAYVRNVVLEPLDGAPPLDAIVEEQFRARGDLLRPTVMFGGAWRMLPNMIAVGLDIRGFIDLASLSTYLATEVHLALPRGV